MKINNETMKKLKGSYILKLITHGESEEIVDHKKNVYEWRGVFFEVVEYEKKTAPASHYATIKHEGKKWSIRELGDKSKLLIELKK